MSQHSGHIGQGHQHDRPNALTTADLNNASHVFVGSDAERLRVEQTYFPSVKAGQTAPHTVDDAAVGRATYSFIVGDAGVPHVYTAEVTADGRIIHEKVYYMRDSQHIVETKVGPNVIAQFEQFALADISNTRKTSIEPYVQVHSDVSRLNNPYRAKLLNDAGTKDAQSILLQQRMPEKP